MLIYTLNPRTQEDLCEFKASQGYIASLGQESCIVRFCLKIGLIKKERKKEKIERKKKKFLEVEKGRSPCKLP